MLKISIDNRNHTDALGHSRKAGPKAAHTAHDQIDPHAGLGGAIEFFDDGGINETVYFRNNASGLAVTRMFGFPPNQSDESIPSSRSAPTPGDETFVAWHSPSAG